MITPLLLCSLLLVSGCSSSSGGKIIPRWDVLEVPAAEDVLRIGVSPDYPPLIFKRNGRIVGLEAELARKLASAMGREPIFVEMDFIELIPSLMHGKIDVIMSGMSMTDQRSIRVAFTLPYLQVGQIALVRNEDMYKYDNVGILVGKPTIGVEKGTTGAMFTERNCRKSKIKQYVTIEKAAKALIGKRVDVVIGDAPVVWWMASTYEAQGLTYQPQPFTKELIAWGVLPENGDMLDEINGILSRWMDDGTVTRFLKKWLPNN